MEMILLVLSLVVTSSWALGTKDVVVIILSQENEYHLKLAEGLKNDLHRQAEILHQEHPVVHLSHRDFRHVGGWTILPLIPRLCNLHKENSSWLFFVEDRTEVRLATLLDVLSKHDINEQVWLGHALHDQTPTIIHHFAFYEDPEGFKYPNVASGVAISSALLERLADRLNSQISPPSDFGIDNGHELALFIFNKGTGERLQHEPALCIADRPQCASFPKPFRQCGEAPAKGSIYFAVKTCEKYHENRVEVVKDTWARHATRINFFSDVRDDSIPTIALGIPNTEQGHCGKTKAILEYVSRELDEMPDVEWVIIADDDTLLRVQQLLTCYNSSARVALGERYGYNVHNPRGYNYITGGGGMVFSRTLVKKLGQSGVCECPSINTPDDMFLGLCMAELGVTVTHSPLFHQGRPKDYSRGYLHTLDAVSFHKHWMIDPVAVYNKWFGEDDLKISNLHNEL